MKYPLAWLSSLSDAVLAGQSVVVGRAVPLAVARRDLAAMFGDHVVSSTAGHVNFRAGGRILFVARHQPERLRGLRFDTAFTLPQSEPRPLSEEMERALQLACSSRKESVSGA